MKAPTCLTLGAALASLATAGVFAADAREAERAVVGNALHILLHETGHMLVSELMLPVLGQEEDAVDSFATITLLQWNGEAAADALEDTARAWFLSHEAMAKTSDDLAYYGEHDLDVQRAYRLVCHLYGLDPKAYGGLADEVSLPDERRESCVDDYELAQESWEVLLEDNLRGENDPASRIEIDYRSAGDLAPVAAILRRAEVLETVRDFVADRYVLPEPINMVAAACGEPQAYWDPETRDIMLCYELLEDIRLLFASASPTRP